jgi:hypothetical protein
VEPAPPVEPAPEPPTPEPPKPEPEPPKAAEAPKKAEPKKAEPKKAAAKATTEKAPPGSVYIDVPGSWARIFIGKKSYGETPTTLKLAPGRYNITLENTEAKKKHTFPITIVSGVKTQINEPL